MHTTVETDLFSTSEPNIDAPHSLIVMQLSRSLFIYETPPEELANERTATVQIDKYPSFDSTDNYPTQSTAETRIEFSYTTEDSQTNSTQREERETQLDTETVGTETTAEFCVGNTGTPGFIEQTKESREKAKEKKLRMSLAMGLALFWGASLVAPPEYFDVTCADAVPTIYEAFKHHAPPPDQIAKWMIPWPVNSQGEGSFFPFSSRLS